MSEHDVEALCQLTDAVLQAERSRLRDILQRESGLRRRLADLEALKRGALSLSEDDMAAVRHCGADVLWQGWAARRRAALQQELARVLARKARRLADLHRAHGKHEAAGALAARHRQDRAAAACRRHHRSEQALAVLKAGLADRSWRQEGGRAAVAAIRYPAARSR